MADRWSNPSGGIGVDRFRVWAGGSDSYSHTDLANNWDTLDGLLGQPSDASTWPPTQGLNGGIYKEIRLLQLDRAPIGTVVPWFRPANTVPIPTGWAPCDGSVIAVHNFPGIGGSVTLPDMRNAFVLGADATLAFATAAAVVSSGNINIAAGAPGEGASGGANTIVQTEAQLAAHSHGGQTGAAADVIWEKTSSGQSIVLNATGNDTTTSTHVHPIATDGSGAPMDNRPRWVGLIYICKVLFASSI